MQTTRRGFLKLLGKGAAAVIVAPVLPAMPEAKPVEVVDPAAEVVQAVEPLPDALWSNQLWQRLRSDHAQCRCVIDPYVITIDGGDRTLGLIRLED